MPTANEAQTVYERGWIIRIRPANISPPNQIFLMIHGWTGDERSMQVFARGLPADNLIFFPRGPLQAAGGGYGWINVRSEILARIEDLAQPAQSLLEEVDWRIREITGSTESSLNIVGFSQGAAVAYTMALLYPHRIVRLAALAGFLPALSSDHKFPHLAGLQVYVAHGKKDETIPIDRAREAVKLIRAAGAEVDFCENEAGHKLPANCFSALTRFLTS